MEQYPSTVEVISPQNCGGRYCVVAGKQVDGLPLWKQADTKDPFYISSCSGCWIIHNARDISEPKPCTWKYRSQHHRRDPPTASHIVWWSLLLHGRQLFSESSPLVVRPVDTLLSPCFTTTSDYSFQSPSGHQPIPINSYLSLVFLQSCGRAFIARQGLGRAHNSQHATPSVQPTPSVQRARDGLHRVWLVGTRLLLRHSEQSLLRVRFGRWLRYTVRRQRAAGLEGTSAVSLMRLRYTVWQRCAAVRMRRAVRLEATARALRQQSVRCHLSVRYQAWAGTVQRSAARLKAQLTHSEFDAQLLTSDGSPLRALLWLTQQEAHCLHDEEPEPQEAEQDVERPETQEAEQDAKRPETQEAEQDVERPETQEAKDDPLQPQNPQGASKSGTPVPSGESTQTPQQQSPLQAEPLQSQESEVRSHEAHHGGSPTTMAKRDQLVHSESEMQSGNARPPQSQQSEWLFDAMASEEGHTPIHTTPPPSPNLMRTQPQERQSQEAQPAQSPEPPQEDLHGEVPPGVATGVLASHSPQHSPETPGAERSVWRAHPELSEEAQPPQSPQSSPGFHSLEARPSHDLHTRQSAQPAQHQEGRVFPPEGAPHSVHSLEVQVSPSQYSHQSDVTPLNPRLDTTRQHPSTLSLVTQPSHSLEEGPEGQSSSAPPEPTSGKKAKKRSKTRKTPNETPNETPDVDQPAERRHRKKRAMRQSAAPCDSKGLVPSPPRDCTAWSIPSGEEATQGPAVVSQQPHVVPHPPSDSTAARAPRKLSDAAPVSLVHKEKEGRGEVDREWEMGLLALVGRSAEAQTLIRVSWALARNVSTSHLTTRYTAWKRFVRERAMEAQTQRRVSRALAWSVSTSHLTTRYTAWKRFARERAEARNLVRVSRALAWTGSVSLLTTRYTAWKRFARERTMDGRHLLAEAYTQWRRWTHRHRHLSTLATSLAFHAEVRLLRNRFALWRRWGSTAWRYRVAAHRMRCVEAVRKVWVMGSVLSTWRRWAGRRKRVAGIRCEAKTRCLMRMVWLWSRWAVRSRRMHVLRVEGERAVEARVYREWSVGCAVRKVEAECTTKALHTVRSVQAKAVCCMAGFAVRMSLLNRFVWWRVWCRWVALRRRAAVALSSAAGLQHLRTRYHTMHRLVSHRRSRRVLSCEKESSSAVLHASRYYHRWLRTASWRRKGALAATALHGAWSQGLLSTAYHTLAVFRTRRLLSKKVACFMGHATRLRYQARVYYAWACSLMSAKVRKTARGAVAAVAACGQRVLLQRYFTLLAQSARGATRRRTAAIVLEQKVGMAVLRTRFSAWRKASLLSAQARERAVWQERVSQLESYSALVKQELDLWVQATHVESRLLRREPPPPPAYIHPPTQ